jgi:AcrR family transcriptional regulator
VKTTRSRSKRGEGERLREEILDAAEAILLETGSAEKVSTRAVARRVGCSSPSIYLHFPDRAEMLFAMCQRQFDQMGARLHEAAAGIDDPVERLRALGRAYVSFALEHPQQYRTMMMDVIQGVAYQKNLEEMRAELGFDVLFDVVTDGIEQGVFETADPLLSAFSFWAVGHGVVSLMIAKPSLGWAEPMDLCEFAMNQVIDGLRVRDHPAEARRAKKQAKRARPGGV